MLYLPSVNNDFVWDAKIFTVDNPSIRDLNQLSSIFSQPGNQQSSYQSDQVNYLPYYRPLTKAFQIVTYAAFGDQPAGYKIISILLHAGVSLLVFLLFVSIIKSPWPAFLGALIWAVKPTHVEAVAWTYSASYLLTALFALGALLLYRHGPRWLALIVFCLALLFNELGILLLPILVLHRWLLEQARQPREFAPLLPYVLIVAAFLALRTSIVGAVPLSNVDPLTFLNTSVVILQRYLKIFFWPDAPVTLYLAETFTRLSIELVVSYLLAATLGALALWLWLRDRAGLFWLLWFCGWISLSFNIGRFGDYLMADKLIYIAAIGPSMLLVSTLQRLSKDNKPLWVIPVLGFALIQGTATWNSLPHWQNTQSYLQAALRFAPGYATAHYALADSFIEQQDYPQAKVHLLESIALKPGFSLALNNLANIHYAEGDMNQAVAYWQQAIASAPTNPQPYFNVGITLQQQGNIDDARRYYRRYLELEPNPQPQVLRVITPLLR